MKTWAIFATVDFADFSNGSTYPAPVKIASGWPTKESVDAAKEQIEAAREKSYWTWLFDVVAILNGRNYEMEDVERFCEPGWPLHVELIETENTQL